MAIFAKLENNVVVDVIIADNIEWINENLEGNWIETVENGSIRYNYAGIGYTYDPINDAFISPQPYPSWALDQNFNWQPPTPRPEGEWIKWRWDEATTSWVEVTL